MPVISCLMVTQPARFRFAEQAIADFAAQTHSERELVVVHDGDAAYDTTMSLLAGTLDGGLVRVVRADAGQTLGALRNAAITAAAGDFVCQWDDDDRYHPQRLALQWQALQDARADFCFLSDQLHWFPERGELFWDDWDGEPYPMNLIQGSLLGRRERMPRYPEIARGEDTGAVLDILRRGEKVVRLRDAGWCYVYVYHGGNVWSADHHLAISRAKAFSMARLLQREAMLRQRLAEYRPGFGRVRMPHASGELLMQETSGHQVSR
ncbi:MAG: glycosyltransferase family A protein [Rhodanobacteraceae bacterium]